MCYGLADRVQVCITLSGPHSWTKIILPSVTLNPQKFNISEAGFNVLLVPVLFIGDDNSGKSFAITCIFLIQANHEKFKSNTGCFFF